MPTTLNPSAKYQQAETFIGFINRFDEALNPGERPLIPRLVQSSGIDRRNMMAAVRGNRNCRAKFWEQLIEATNDVTGKNFSVHELFPEFFPLEKPRAHQRVPLRGSYIPTRPPHATAIVVSAEGIVRYTHTADRSATRDTGFLVPTDRTLTLTLADAPSPTFYGEKSTLQLMWKVDA